MLCKEINIYLHRFFGGKSGHTRWSDCLISYKEEIHTSILLGVFKQMAWATRCRKKQQLVQRDIEVGSWNGFDLTRLCQLCDQNKADCLVFFGLNLASCPSLKAHSGSALSKVRIPQIKGQRFHREIRMVRCAGGVLTGSPQGAGNFRRLTGGEAESQSWKSKCSTPCLCTSLLFVNLHVFFFLSLLPT